MLNTEEITAALLSRVPTTEDLLVTGLDARPAMVDEVFRQLLRTGQIQRVGNFIVPVQPSAARDRFRQELLDALTPVLDRWYLSELTQPQQRRELLYAFDGRLAQLTKRCPQCRDVLPREAFGLNAAHRDGLQSVCRECRKR